MSFVGNCGTFTRGYKAMIMDVEFLYHLLYLLICALGLFVHEFFYSLLVGIHFVFRMFFFLCACKVPPRCHPLLAFCFTTGHCRAGTLLKLGLWWCRLEVTVGGYKIPALSPLPDFYKQMENCGSSQAYQARHLFKVKFS